MFIIYYINNIMCQQITLIIGTSPNTGHSLDSEFPLIYSHTKISIDKHNAATLRVLNNES